MHQFEDLTVKFSHKIFNLKSIEMKVQDFLQL